MIITEEKYNEELTRYVLPFIRPVSYTHLDVYKRQQKRFMKSYVKQKASLTKKMSISCEIGRASCRERV